MPVEITDEELADLRAAKEEREAFNKERGELSTAKEAAEKQVAEIRAEAERQLGQAAAVIQQLQAGTKKAEPEAAEIDDDAILTGKEFRKASEENTRRIAGAMNHDVLTVLKNQRATAKAVIRGSLSNFDKYEKEIDGYLDKVDPRLSANPEAYQQAWKIVRAEHIEDELEERSNAKSEETVNRILREKGLIGDEEESELPEAAHGGRVIDIPMVPGNASPRPALRAAKPNSKKELRLTAQQKYFADRFNVSADEYAQFSDASYEPDVFGFKGRSRI